MALFSIFVSVRLNMINMMIEVVYYYRNTLNPILIIFIFKISYYTVGRVGPLKLILAD